MRTRFITTESRSILVRRLSLVCVAVAAISISTFAPATRAAVPASMGGSVNISISYFGVTYGGGNNWLADGIVQAQNMSAVTIKFGGPTTATTTVNGQGRFSLIFVASPGQFVTVDATDSTGTAHAQAPLNNYQL